MPGDRTPYRLRGGVTASRVMMGSAADAMCMWGVGAYSFDACLKSFLTVIDHALLFETERRARGIYLYGYF